MSKIAIVIVNYNDSRFLPKLVNKFCQQTPDYLIVVDDGSTEIDLDGLRALLPCSVIKNTETKGPFGAFITGCKATDAEYVSCWSADDLPEDDYIEFIKHTIKNYPFINLISCNAHVEREREIFQRTLLPWTTYISPEYAVKIFKNGFYKQLNLIGSVIKKDTVLHAWANKGYKLKVNFDGMYFFHTLFKSGMINIGIPLVKYRSYCNGLGASGRYKDLQRAIEIHKEYYKNNGTYDKAIESGIWSLKAQWRAQIALRLINFLPKFIRVMFYKWFYSYNYRIEKL